MENNFYVKYCMYYKYHVENLLSYYSLYFIILTEGSPGRVCSI